MTSIERRGIDLAAARLGGRALIANDEFFAAKENLLRPEPAVFVEGKYTDRGKWMDGWETRRRRAPGSDWCIVRLGLAGRIEDIVVDTRHFDGNHPEACSLDVLDWPAEQAEPPPEQLPSREDWRPLLARAPLGADRENRFKIADPERVSHLRLTIHPDGGVARLRIFGTVLPDWASLLGRNEPIDLVAVGHGGRPVASSDARFSAPHHLIMPGRGSNMGDGWETRRRRGPGHDWVVLSLGRRGAPSEALVDTRHFKGNHPASCSLDVCDLGGIETDPDADVSTWPWRPALAEHPLEPDNEHRLHLAPACAPITHVRLNIFPDGGVSRFRLFGRPEAS